MHLFYLNDCLPPVLSQSLFASALQQSLVQFNALIQKSIGIDRGIVSHTEPSGYNYGGGCTLKSALGSISDRDVRTIGFSLFTRYPVSPAFNDAADEFIAEDFRCTVAGKEMDATNLAIVERNSGFVFTPAFDACLEEDLLRINVTGTLETRLLHNLFGQVANTAVIEAEIIRRNMAQLNRWDQFVATAGVKNCSKQFRKDFSALSVIHQEIVIKHFEAARNRRLTTPYYPDDNIIKNVTFTGAAFSVFELRIFSPVALRVYFAELAGGGLLLGSIGAKNNNQQDQDIRQAHTLLIKLRLTNT